MILLDRKKINLNKPIREADGAEKHILQAIKDIEELYEGKFPLTFKFDKSLWFDRVQVGASKKGRGRVIKKTKDTIYIKAKRSVMIDGKRHEIQYYETERMDKNGRVEYKPRHIDASPTFKVDSFNSDLAFYLMLVSPNVKSSFTSAKFKKIDEQIYSNYLEFVDEAEEAHDFAAKIKSKSAFENKLFNELSEEQVRDAAILYGTDSESDSYVVRKKLYDKIMLLDTQKEHVDAFSEFVEKVSALNSTGSKDVSGEVRIKSVIVNGIKANVFVYDKNKWYLYEGEEAKQELCTRSGAKKKEDVLFEYLSVNMDTVEEVEKMI